MNARSFTPGRRAVVLFTRDLRVHDNHALTAAVSRAARVIPLFVLDDALLRVAGTSNRLAFLLDALGDLRRSLRELGGDLILRRGDAVEETLRVARAAGADSVFVGADVSAYAQRRERRLAHECGRERLRLRIENTIAAVPAGELVPVERDHYRLFTPYWQRWRSAPLPQIVAPPERLTLPGELETGRLPALRELSAEQPSPNLPRGGESEGRRRLERWLADGLPRYERDRDDLSADGTSRLSPYLHFGCLSATEVVSRARAGSESADAFIRQLCWRDFYGQLLAANPATPSEDLHARGDDWSGNEEALSRWREGRTGYPIVDAAMRQLQREGWLHNRARLIVGSFLTKTLYLDWRHGARVFFDLLVDADLGNNIGNWQWVAGTGVDPRPNRVFNPVAQAQRYDRDGTYVRRYVPELAELSGRAVHEPWRAPLARVAPEYPAPMVDYAEAAARFRSHRRAARDDATRA